MLTVMLGLSSLDGIDRSNKHPSLLVNTGVDGPFRGGVAFLLTIRTDYLVQAINSYPVQGHVESPS